MIVRPVEGAEMAMAWPKVKPLVEKCINDRDFSKYYTADDIFDRLASKDMLLWLCENKREIKAIAITVITKYPQSRVADIFMTSGRDMDDWVLELWQTLKNYAKSKRCNEIRAFGRMGWIKVLPDNFKTNGSWSLELDT